VKCVWLHVRVVLRLTLSRLVFSFAAIAVGSCGAQPSDLQTNVRMAAARPASTGAPVSPASKPTNTTADERIDDLLAAVAAGRDGDGLPTRIETALRRNDDAVGATLAFIRGDKATKMIIDALAASSTPAAQDALCSLARDSHLPRHVRAEAVSSLGLVKRPTVATMTEVGELIRTRDPDLLAPALFLAGSVARAGRADHPVHAAAIEKIVLAESARARSNEDVLDALAALGNLGSATVLPRLRAALASGDSRIRAAAARALRLVPDAEADHLLVATLRHDRDPTVRAAAIFSAGFRKLEPLLEALFDTARNDPVDYVRAGAVTLLARSRSLAAQ